MTPAPTRAPAAPSGWRERVAAAWLGRGALACALWPLSQLYRAVVALRKLAYRLGLARAERVGVPVVVVGNLVAGGAGKTPTVLALVRALQARGYAPGIVSRGYGRAEGGVREVRAEDDAVDCGDEPLLLRIRSGAPVVVGADRVAAARRLLALHPSTDLVVSDDGLQHARLARDAQLVVFDERGAGNGWLLPAGPLREPMPSPARAARVGGVPTWVVYNAPHATAPLAGSVARRELAGVVALADWWRGVPASPANWQRIVSSDCVAAAGTARPERFFAMLRDRGLRFTPLALPDHHDYCELPWPGSAAAVVVTEKDAVKLKPQRPGTEVVWVAPLDFALDDDLTAALVAALPPRTARHGHAPA